MSIADKILKRIAELNRDSVTSLTATAEMEQLEWALELVEAQEREEQWTAFADKMPEPPVDGDRRILLVVNTDTMVEQHYFPRAIVYTPRDLEWTSPTGHALWRLANGQSWRLITPPEAP